MLRAALIGLPATGKTTLFQLMTAVREASRAAQGRGEVQIGVSKVPDPRLDHLSAMFKPRKHTPATVEFADLAAAGGGAKALVDVVAYKNADALVHVVRAFTDQAVPHVHESIDPARDAQAMEDELILADLGVVERRLERLEKDLKKSRSADLEKERDLLTRCKDALENGTPLRALHLTGEDSKRLRGFQLLSAKPLLLVINLDEADVVGRRRQRREGRGQDGADHLSLAGRDAGRAGLREDRAGDRPARTVRRRSVPVRPGARAIGPEPRDPRDLRFARLHVVLHGRRGRVPRLVDSARHRRPGWPRARSTPTSSAGSSARRSRPTSGSSRGDRLRPAAITAKCASKARNTSSPTATSSTSVTRHNPPEGRAFMDIRTIAVCEAQVPFVEGGAELHVRSLIAQLRARGYTAERVALPFKWYPKDEILAHAAAWRLLDLSESNGRPIDLVIGTKFPSYFARHDRKVAWLIHQYRAAYELCGTEFSDFDHLEGDVALRARAARARHDDAERMPARVHQRRQHREPAQEVQRPRRRGAVSSAASGRPAGARDLRRLRAGASGGWRR